MVRRREELFWIRKVRRIYDRAENKFTFKVSYETHTKPTPRSIVVAEAFGLGIDESEIFTVLDTELKIKPTDVVFVTGDSGSGKSILLRALKQDLGDQAIDINEVAIEYDKPLIETIGKTVEEGLELLSKVGLNDAFLFLRSYEQLSDGQKYRYKIAKMLESGKQWLLADEFAATLDRDTAKIVAFNLQKLARQQGKAVISATTHRDLLQDLAPNVLVEKRFGKEIQVSHFRDARPPECSLVKEMAIEPGSIADWEALACFHYRGHRTCAPRTIFRLTRQGELCGVVVYSYPPPACFGRRLVFPTMTIESLNAKLSTVNRIVVHPKYRTIGLGAKLLRETLPLAGTPNVELIAVMAKYSPFAVRAGMTKIAVQEPSKAILKIIATLQDLGFNIKLLSSQKYIQDKLECLHVEKLELVRACLAKCDHPRFRKEFAKSRPLPFGDSLEFKRCLRGATVPKLARMLRIVGMLFQAKIYLFWTRTRNQLTEVAPYSE